MGRVAYLVTMRTEEQKAKSRENARRWRERNPDAARAAARRWKESNPEKIATANKRPRQRTYDSVKTKEWRDRRLINPEYRIRINAQANERATAIRRWLDAYKMKCGCADCGYSKHPVALDFDHIGSEKTMNVCNAKSIAQAKREIEKCVVRCSNCHRIKTLERLQQDRKS